MTKEQELVHLRLSATLPSRTHLVNPPEEEIWEGLPQRRNIRAVIVFGKKYKNCAEASKDLGISRQKIRNMAVMGKRASFA